MTTIFNTTKNWRFHVIVAIILAAFPFIASEQDSLTAFFLSKFIGITLAVVAVVLLKHWDDKGLMDDIKNNCTEE